MPGQDKKGEIDTANTALEEEPTAESHTPDVLEWATIMKRAHKERTAQGTGGVALPR